ncbi:MAG TPA: hypothetical protein VGO16_08095 [Pseudonocardiaceae bacterium]|jgi:hypothetical protein|nr:hypothetical protein [Pseudonocardiaceae bacterium]
MCTAVLTGEKCVRIPLAEDEVNLAGLLGVSGPAALVGRHTDTDQVTVIRRPPRRPPTRLATALP